jgi:hypothetical protein
MPFVEFEIGEDSTKSQAKENCGSAKVAPANRVMQLLHLLVKFSFQSVEEKPVETFNDLETIRDGDTTQKSD